MARTVTKVETIYQVNELTGVNYRNALDSVSRLRTEFWGEFNGAELVASMEKASEYFGMRVYDYQVSLFSRSYIEIDTEGFDDEQSPYAVEWLEHNLQAGMDGSCPFTGVYYDCFFFDYFKDNGIPTTKTVKREIVRAIMYMMKAAISNEENSILSDDDTLDHIVANELEFLGDGTIYEEAN